MFLRWCIALVCYYQTRKQTDLNIWIFVLYLIQGKNILQTRHHLKFIQSICTTKSWTYNAKRKDTVFGLQSLNLNFKLFDHLLMLKTRTSVLLLGVRSWICWCLILEAEYKFSAPLAKPQSANVMNVIFAFWHNFNFQVHFDFYLGKTALFLPPQ